jgi:2-methylcitrate dehydratase PrpD
VIATDLATWTEHLRLADIPDRVQTIATRHLLDGVGNALAARRLGHGLGAWTVAHALGGPAQARAVTGRQAVSSPAATLATGVLLHALDFDDTHTRGLVHATAVSLPAAFSVGQEVAASGAEILTAAIAGLETVCRLGAASPHGFHTRGLHATAVCGTLSSALVAGRLTSLSTPRLIDALGIAGSASGGLMEFLDTGADTKSLHPGMAGTNGVLAARLAAAGASGPASVIEGDRGIYRALSASAAEPDAVTRALGQRWETERISIKPYPSCQLMHAALDAVAAAPRVAPDSIAEVEVAVHPDSVAIVCGPHAGTAPPHSSYAAKFDLPWSVAALLTDAEVTVGTYAGDSIARPDVAALAGRVRVVPTFTGGPAADAPGRAVIRLTDGSTVVGEVAGSRGTRANPLSEDDVLAKFVDNCGAHRRATELAERIRGLAAEQSLTAVLDLAAEIAETDGDRSPSSSKGQ